MLHLFINMILIRTFLNKFEKNEFTGIWKCNKKGPTLPPSRLGGIQPVKFHTVILHRYGNLVSHLLFHQCKFQSVVTVVLPLCTNQSRKIWIRGQVMFVFINPACSNFCCFKENIVYSRSKLLQGFNKWKTENHIRWYFQ